MEKMNPSNKMSEFIKDGVKVAAIAGAVLTGGSALAQDQGEINRKKFLEEYIAANKQPADMKVLQGVVNTKFKADFASKNYGGVNFFPVDSKNKDKVSLEIVFFAKDKTNGQIVEASQGVYTMFVTIDAKTANNRDAIEILLSGIVAKQLGK